MKKKITLLLILFLTNYSFAQDNLLRLVNPVYEDQNNTQARYTFTYGNPVSPVDYPIPTIPGADNFFDYVTNGKNMTNIIVLGDTIIVGYFGADSTDPTGANSRVAYYIFSVDGGSTWSAPLGASTLPTRSAYPDVHAVFGKFGRSVAITGRLYKPTGSRGGSFYDPFFGLGNFIRENVPDDGRDYFSANIGDGYLGGVYSKNDSVYFIKFQYENIKINEGFETSDSINLPSGWTKWNNASFPINPRANWTVRDSGSWLPGLSNNTAVSHSGIKSCGVSWWAGYDTLTPTYGISDAWLVTKRVENIEVNDTLKFWATGGAASYYDSLQVWISLIDSTPAGFLSTTIKLGNIYWPVGSTFGAFQEYKYSLWPYAGVDSMWIGFRYNLNVTTQGFFVQIDDVFLGNSIASAYSGKTFVGPPTQYVRYQLNADDSGNNLFAMWWNHTTGSEAMLYKTSSDGGTTWSSQGTLQQSAGVNGVINGDTCGPWYGMDVTYKPGTSDVFAAWSTLYPTGTGMSSGDPQGCKILVWSPNLNSGVPVESAGRINMTNISDTVLFNNRADLQVGSTPISHPSIAFTEDGSALACFFSSFQPGDTLDGFTFQDIYSTYSTNGGANWTTPENITSTSTWDEMYPTVSEVGNTRLGNTYTWRIHYQATRGPGSQSFTDNTPVYRVHEVYQKVVVTLTPVKEIKGNVPGEFSLLQNYPNPFNPTTKIRFDIPRSSYVRLIVFDVLGREVARLVNEKLSEGGYEVEWSGSGYPSGVYFYRLETNNFKETKKMLLIK